MRKKIQLLLLRLRKEKHKRKELKKLSKHNLLKIVTKKRTSLILNCFGVANNPRGTRSLTWNNILIFNETKSQSLKKGLKKLYKEWGSSGKSLEDFMDLKALKFSNEINKVLTKFKLSVKTNTITIDLVDELGTVVFRGIRKNVQKYTDFIKKSSKEKKLLIEDMNKRIATKTNKYNPELAIEKGYDDIPISKNGTSPDFDGLTHYLYNGDPAFGKVKIKVTGSRDKDFAQCLKQMGLDEIPEGYTWHHLDDLDENLECTMQLVLSEAHEATITHLGSALQFRELFNITEEYL